MSVFLISRTCACSFKEKFIRLFLLEFLLNVLNEIVFELIPYLEYGVENVLYIGEVKQRVSGVENVLYIGEVKQRVSGVENVLY